MVRWYPRDTRWHGVQKHYFNASTFKSFVLVAYVVLIVVESILIRRWLREDYDDYTLSTTSAPWDFWARTGIYLMVDAAFSLIMAYFTWKDKWHPIAALVTSILLFGLWFAACFVNSLIVYSNEFYFTRMDEWRRIGYGEAGLQGTIVACYMIMIGLAAKAVHVLRKNRKNVGTMNPAYNRVDEMALVERGVAKDRASEGGIV